MDKLLNVMARILARVTFTSAVAGANSASLFGIYQPKTPKTLLQNLSSRTK